MESATLISSDSDTIPAQASESSRLPEHLEGDTSSFDKVPLVCSEASPKIDHPVVIRAKVTDIGVSFPLIKVVSQLFRRRKNAKIFTPHNKSHASVNFIEIAGAAGSEEKQGPDYGSPEFRAALIAHFEKARNSVLPDDSIRK